MIFAILRDSVSEILAGNGGLLLFPTLPTATYGTSRRRITFSFGCSPHFLNFCIKSVELNIPTGETADEERSRRSQKLVLAHLVGRRARRVTIS